MRVVSHLDMDCFYAQVETKRLGLSPEIPLVVQQWKNVIAVNYPARKFGIKRGMSAQECKRLCPEVVCALVEIMNHEYDVADETDSSKIVKKIVQKVSLERYRLASEEIMSIINNLNPKCERGGIDELFVELDCSHIDSSCLPDFNKLLSKESMHPIQLELPHNMNHKNHFNPSFDSVSDVEMAPIMEIEPIQNTTHTIPIPISDINFQNIRLDCDLLNGIDNNLLDINDPFDRHLIIAAYKVYKIRQAVYEQTGFTVSAGISCKWIVYIVIYFVIIRCISLLFR